MKTKYPIYIVSKGRYENPITAKSMLREGLDFKIVIEPQELNDYKKTIPEKNILVTDFSNLGTGSYPARNFAWEDSKKNGFDFHFIFDDNIYDMRRLHKGERRRDSWENGIKWLTEFTERYNNIGISGFNYEMFATRQTKKPLVVNCHVYSGMMIRNSLPFRWRLKYNEDVDLCLNALDRGWCTVLFNAFLIKKVSTTAKMKGGNQDELYKGNAHEKKVLKARSLEEIWPQYAETRLRFGRPHHYVDWKKHFKHGLIKNA